MTRLDDGVFWKSVKRLRDEFGTFGTDLPTFMSDSVAARLDDKALLKSLKRLHDDFGVAGKGLPNFMSNSVTA